MEGLVIQEKGRQIELISIVSMLSFIISLVFSSLNISLSSIAAYFNVKAGLVAWLPISYLLIITSSLLGFGKLGDIIGYKKVFLAGMVIFSAGTFLCAIAKNFPFLFAGIIVLALGEAMYSPICIAFLTTYLPIDIKGRALGFYATFQGLGLAAGPVIGGFMNANFNWRGNFIIVLCLGLILTAVSIKKLPAAQKMASDTRFDLPGAVWLFITLAALLFAVNNGTRMGWNNPLILGSLSVFAVTFAIFILQEKRTVCPLLDFSLFKNRNFTFAALACFCALAMYIGVVFLLPFYLQMMRHLDVAKAGLVMMVPSIMMMLLAPVGGAISDKLGSRKLCMLGMLVAAVAFAMMFTLTQSTSVRFIVGSLICFGTGMGLFIAPNNKQVMINASAEKQGVASGVYKIAVNAGSSIGIALFMLVLAQVVLFDIAKLQILLSEVRQHLDIIMQGFKGAFAFGFLLALVSLLFSGLSKDRN